MSGNKKPLCSIKGCEYDAMISIAFEGRTYRLCPKHKILAYKSPYNWSVMKK